MIKIINLVSQIIANLINILPAFLFARIYIQLKKWVAMDYKEASIWLSAISPMAYYRRNSASKEPDTIAWIEKYSKEDDTFLDIGANIGAYSFVFAKNIRSGTVIAIEPSYSTYGALVENILYNKKLFSEISFIPLNLALGSDDQISTFKFSTTEAGAALHNSPSINVASLGVMTVTLDTLFGMTGLSSPNLVKIDVDGPELSILAGAKQTLENKSVRSILIELHQNTLDLVTSDLRSLGFHLESVVNRGEFCNAIFVKQ